MADNDSYLQDYIDEIERITYGKDNRKQIHDVIEAIVNKSADYATWAEDIGLIVQDGKLCVSYDSTGATDDTPRVIPDNIKTMIANVLTDVYMSQMRNNIHDTIEWSFNTVTGSMTPEESLGLIVQNGMLCVVTGDDEDDDSQDSEESSIPDEIQTALDDILTDISGKDLRKNIVKVLRWGLSNDYTNNDIGLSVVNGKLCIEYEEGS